MPCQAVHFLRCSILTKTTRSHSPVGEACALINIIITVIIIIIIIILINNINIITISL